MVVILSGVSPYAIYTAIHIIIKQNGYKIRKNHKNERSHTCNDSNNDNACFYHLYKIKGQ